MISWYIVLGHQRITTNALSLAPFYCSLFLTTNGFMHVTWSNDKRQQRLTYVIYSPSISISMCIRIHISLSILVSLCICAHIISLERKFDVNVLQCDTTHHRVLRNEMTSKRWNEFFVYLFGVTFSSAVHIRCALCAAIHIVYSSNLRAHATKYAVPHNIYLVMPHAAYCYHHYLHLFMDSLWLHGFEWWFWFKCKQFTYNYIPCKTHSLPTHTSLSFSLSLSPSHQLQICAYFVHSYMCQHINNTNFWQFTNRQHVEDVCGFFVTKLSIIIKFYKRLYHLEVNGRQQWA